MAYEERLGVKSGLTAILQCYRHGLAYYWYISVLHYAKPYTMLFQPKHLCLFTVLAALMLLPCIARCNDTAYIKVLFLYGSKPAKGFKQQEPKWFGGMLGGHAGIEGAQDSVLSFVPNGKFHWVAKKSKLHSRYIIDTEKEFWQILGGHEDSVKKAIVVIPLTTAQKQKFDSIQQAYLQNTPYDYALIGMRCGAAAYDILAQLDVLKQYGYKKTYSKIFYPQKLRKRLFALAEKNSWAIIRHAGSSRRKWEGD